jgi:hypothetical protein
MSASAATAPGAALAGAGPVSLLAAAAAAAALSQRAGQEVRMVTADELLRETSSATKKRKGRGQAGANKR